ncbi:MAG: FAD-dependent oxidoreductase [Candidatus Omnitrophota bacterium]
MPKQFVIIGNSAAGIAAIEGIRRRDSTSRICVISDEDYPAYCRCLLSYYLAGEVGEDKILYRPKDFYQENGVELLLNKKVLRIEPKKNRIQLEDKAQISYDALLVATGATPKFPDIPGIKKRGVFGLRTVKDAKEIEGFLPVTKTACVLGGGLIGLKAAAALKKRGSDVKVIIKSGQVLSQMLDSEAASIVQNKLEANGIEIILGSDAAEVIGNGDLKAVKLNSGKVIGCSLVVVGKGVEPNINLAQDTEIKINEGIISNNLMQTNIPDIYTAGDVCENLDITKGLPAINALWPIAVEQGKLAGANISGEKLQYEGSVGMNSIQFFGLPIVSLGLYKIKEGEAKLEDAKLSSGEVYKRLIFRDNILIGAILIGDIKDSGLYLKLIRERISVLPFKERLLQENFCFADIKDFISKDISYGAGYLNDLAT